MEWSEVINNPLFQNLPFKIELNKYGQILMSPASNRHGSLQYTVGEQIKRKKRSGEIIIECSIQTSDGVKVADVAWASAGFIEKYGFETPYRHAPEICVEVVSPSNSKEEIANKVELYLAKGAEEVWIVTVEKQISYFDPTGKIEKSSLVKSIKL